jgi:hypothetical protein
MMDEYRLYFVDHEGQRLSAFDFTSTDDHCAETGAKQFGCERGAELWCGSRWVGGWLEAGATSQARRSWPASRLA